MWAWALDEACADARIGCIALAPIRGTSRETCGLLRRDSGCELEHRVDDGGDGSSKSVLSQYCSVIQLR